MHISMKKKILLAAWFALFLGAVSAWAQWGPRSIPEPTDGLKDAYQEYFKIGVSVNNRNVTDPAQMALILREFNSITAENAMKPEPTEPRKGEFHWEDADRIADFCRRNGIRMRGHTLMWHSQIGSWMYQDEKGNLLPKEEFYANMKHHIQAIVSRYKDVVYCWDVVNEAFEDNGTLRRSKFYEILGEDFIPLAVQYAHEADPTVELYYNDYSMNKAQKVDAVVNFFRPLVQKGLPITAIGMQGHLIFEDTDYVPQYEHAIQAIASLGLKAQFSELDLSALPNPYGFSGANVSDRFQYREELDPYKNGISAEQQQKIDAFWVDLFTMLMKHKDDVLRVGFWCLNDANSWRNDFPVKGRTDYATLFGRDNQPKSTVGKLIDLAAPVSEAPKKSRKK